MKNDLMTQIIGIVFITIITLGMMTVVSSSGYTTTTTNTDYTSTFDSVNISLVNTTTVATGISMPHERKIFNYNERYWIFYSDGNNFKYLTSLDGISWTQSIMLHEVNVTSGSRISIYFNGTTVCYALTTVANWGVYFRMGNPQTDGTITWLTDEQTVLPPINGLSYALPYIIMNTNNYYYISILNMTLAPLYNAVVLTSSTKNGTWTTDNTFTKTLPSTYGASNMILPLTNGKISTIYANGTYSGDNYCNIIVYNGSSWSTPVRSNIIQFNAVNPSALSIGDNIYIAYVNNNNFKIVFEKYTYSTNSMTFITTITDDYVYVPVISLTLDTNTNNIYAFWMKGQTQIKYAEYSYINNVFGETKILLTTSNIPNGLAYNPLSTSYQFYNNKLQLSFLNGTGPYNIYFVSSEITETTLTSTLTTDEIGIIRIPLQLLVFAIGIIILMLVLKIMKPGKSTK